MICDTKGSLLSLLYNITRVRFRLAGVPVRDAIRVVLSFLFFYFLSCLRQLSFFSPFISFPFARRFLYLSPFPSRVHSHLLRSQDISRVDREIFTDQKHQQRPVTMEKLHNRGFSLSRSFLVLFAFGDVKGISNLTIARDSASEMSCERSNDKKYTFEIRTFPSSPPLFSSSD